MIARHILVHGRVQGVFFRGWTVDVARSLRLTGWVRNRRGGEVEILAVGASDAIDTLIEKCREGPPAAQVERLHVTEAVAETLNTFEQRPTL